MKGGKVAMGEGQCFYCLSRLFFEPLASEIFTMCQAHGEQVEQIDAGTGVSPAIQRHLIDGVPCDKFGAGRSPCEPSLSEPFNIPSIREEGERWLLENRLAA